MIRDKGQKWEAARRDAWLQELLTDSSGSESEDKYSRFAESGRWIAERQGVPQARGKCGSRNFSTSDDDMAKGVFQTMRSRDHDVILVRRTIDLRCWEFGMGREWGGDGKGEVSLRVT